jgi:hypothetical protein
MAGVKPMAEIDMEASQTRDYCVARLAQIPFGFAHGRLSRRKERLLGMTIYSEAVTSTIRVTIALKFYDF